MLSGAECKQKGRRKARFSRSDDELTTSEVVRTFIVRVLIIAISKLYAGTDLLSRPLAGSGRHSRLGFQTSWAVTGKHHGFEPKVEPRPVPAPLCT